MVPVLKTNSSAMPRVRVTESYEKTSLANQLTKFEAAFVAIKDTFDCWKWLIFERMLLKFTATGLSMPGVGYINMPLSSLSSKNWGAISPRWQYWSRIKSWTVFVLGKFFLSIPKQSSSSSGTSIATWW